MVADDGEAFLILPKFGKTKKDHGPLRIRMHRPLPVGARIKTVTLAQEADWWFASLNCEAEVAAVAPSPKPAGAADVGVEVPVMTNTGRSFTMPVLTPRRTERRRRLQRALARKKRGSTNRNKARRALARDHAKDARRKNDTRRKIARTLADSHGLIVFEDLKTKSMTASAKGTLDEPGTNVAQKAELNRAILEVGWGTIVRYTAEAAARTGSTVIKVPAAYTSQTCPSCRHVSAENRPERSRFVCLSCGYAGQADRVAAENLLARGLADLEITDQRHTGGRPVAACGELCASISLKQEARAVRLEEGARL
jgi:putative transposase